MTLDEVKAEVAEIKECEAQRSAPAGHIAEDLLYFNLLKSIADGTCADPKACAAEAIKTKDFEFPRWFE